MVEQDELLGAAELADVLGVGVSTVRQRVLADATRADWKFRCEPIRRRTTVESYLSRRWWPGPRPGDS